MTNATQIFLDTNVFMYVVGKEHPLKRPSTHVLELAARNSSFFTNAEVIQEILHRYLAQRRWRDVKPFLEPVFLALDDRVLEVRGEDVRKAGDLALVHLELQTRDLIHLAIMQRVGSAYVVSADRAFDGIEGITRLDPVGVDEWQSLVTGD